MADMKEVRVYHLEQFFRDHNIPQSVQNKVYAMVDEPSPHASIDRGYVVLDDGRGQVYLCNILCSIGYGTVEAFEKKG